MGVPGFGRKHGFNHIVLNGWTCSGEMGSPLKVWSAPNAYLGTLLSDSDAKSITVLKDFYKAGGVTVLANAFGEL